MKSIWNKRPTPSPISVGQFSGNSEDGYQMFRNGGYYASQNSLVAPALGVPALSLEFGFGQSLTLDFGGFYAAAPPPPEEP
jgi:hypothetical protein